MPENAQNLPGSVAAALSALRALPLWFLVGLAATGWITMWFLFAVQIRAVDVGAFRQDWGIWIGIATLAFSLLALGRSADMAVVEYLRRGSIRDARRTQRLIPLPRQSWWHLAKQRDDSFITQVNITCQVSNTGNRPVRLVNVRLIRPRAKEISAFVTLPSEGSPYHSPNHAVPAHDTAPASIHLMIRGAVGAQGKPLRVTFGIFDQFGEEYRLRFSVPSHDRPLPPLSIRDRFRPVTRFIQTVLQGLGLVPPPPPEPTRRMPWTFEAGGEYFDTCDAILREEKRSYAARGRRSGQLGTLNVGLQSEPNFGWTKEGEVPLLLWDEPNAKTVSSPNLDRLINLWEPLAPAERCNLEAYLLTHLRKDSDFADVGYFIFLALHRMDRTIDALTTARTCLSGDKVHGYSNILGTLSALVSHEYFKINAGLYQSISNALSGDCENDFRIREKINLALLQQLDRAKGSERS